MKQRTEYTCPLELTHDAIRGKWKPIILWQLSKGGSSLSALKKEIAGISQKMLIQQLSELAPVSYTHLDVYKRQLLCKHAVSVALHHVAKVLVHVIEEQEHVTARGNCPRNLLPPRHGGKHADHMRGVSHHHTVESQASF